MTTSAPPFPKTIFPILSRDSISFEENGEADRKRTEKSFFVPKEEIAANAYDLSINKYKKTDYVPVEYPPTEEILAELKELQQRIDKGLEELEGMV